jgi:hypothetical protein
MAFVRERCGHVWGSHDKEQPTTDLTDLVEQMYDTRHYALISLKVTSDKVKARYDRLVNSSNYKAKEHVWSYGRH